MSNTSWTIEPASDNSYTVYEWGVYPRDSVLAGQTRKSFLNSFETLPEATQAYPKADVMSHQVSAGNTVDHLPDWAMNAYEEEGYWDRLDGRDDY